MIGISVLKAELPRNDLIATVAVIATVRIRIREDTF